MTDADVPLLVQRLRERGSELDDVEAKSARGGTPGALWTTLSAFANRSGGGVILFGLEPVTYRATGVLNLDQLQSDIANVAAHQMSPPVHLGMHAVVIDEQSVLAVEVGEVDRSLGPCFYTNQGLYRGSYVRTGDGDRVMTEYEVFLILSSREQQNNDRAAVPGALISDLDDRQVERFVAELRVRRPSLAATFPDRDRLLEALGVVSTTVGGRPTLAGLLLLGRFPQQFVPNCVITVTAYADDRPDPTRRLPLDAKCEGALPAMLDAAQTTLRRALLHRVEVMGTLHREEPEYPPAALRELLTNAVVHRDYSAMGLGSRVQVQLFPNRVEILNPGGLFGAVSLDRLGEPGVQATRNGVLANLAEDAGLMEQRGTGISVVLGEMRRAGLLPPVWQDGISFFRVTLYNTPAVDGDLAQRLATMGFAALSADQQYAVGYLVKRGHMPGSFYQKINGVDSDLARRALHDLVRSGLVVSEATRQGTVYRLSLEARGLLGQPHPGASIGSMETRVLEVLRSAGGDLSSREIAAALSRSRAAALRALDHLLAAGLVTATSEAKTSRSRRYRVQR